MRSSVATLFPALCVLAAFSLKESHCDVGSLSMDVRCTCYGMSYKPPRGKRRVYWGMTELRGMQSQDDACQVRLHRHKRNPPPCIGGSAASEMEIAPHGPVLSKKNCLAQEAIFAASAVAVDSSARGACFSCKKLGPELRRTVHMILKATRGLHGQEARRAVIHLASSFGDHHPLSRHLNCQCFKCGGEIGKCGCRLSSQAGSSDEKKSRSGTSLSGSDKRKRMGLTPANPKYYEHKWGKNVVANRAADNKKQNAKNPDRPSGKRSRRTLR